MILDETIYLKKKKKKKKKTSALNKITQVLISCKINQFSIATLKTSIYKSLM